MDSKEPNSIINSTIPLITDPKGLDAVIQVLQIELSQRLTWLDKSYGQAWTAAKEYNGETFTYPQVWQGKGTDMLNILENDTLKSFSFFTINDPETINDYRQKGSNFYTANVDLIIVVDLERIDESQTFDHLYLENLSIDVQNSLNAAIIPYNGSIEINEVNRNPNSIFPNFTIDWESNQRLMYPRMGLRFNLSLTYLNDPCGLGANVPNKFCADAIVKLINTEGTLLLTANADSGIITDITAPDATPQIINSDSQLIGNPSLPSGSSNQVQIGDGVASLFNSNGIKISDTDIPASGNQNVTAPDATAVVKDLQGNILATELIPSGESKDIIVEANAMINVLKGDFTGVFDLSVQDQNGFYNDYLDPTPLTLSIGANPTLGAIATVRIIGGSLNALPTNWNFSGDAISADTGFYNEIILLYVSSDDIRIVNRAVVAPDITAPVFAIAPTATNILATSFDITATLNENGTVYGYLLANGSPAPDTDTVIANAQSSFVDSGSGGTLSFTGLIVSTDYDVYIVAEDTSGNKQATPVLVEVLTQAQQTILGTLQPEAAWYDFTNKTVGAFSPALDENGNYTTALIGGSPEYVAGTKLDFTRADNDAISLGSTFSFLRTSTDGFSLYFKFNPKEIGYVNYFIGQTKTANQFLLALNASNQLVVLTEIDNAGVVINTFTDPLFSGAAPYPTINLFIDVIRSTGEIKAYLNSSTVEIAKDATNLIGNITNYLPNNNWYLGARNDDGVADSANDISADFDHVIINNKLFTSAEKQIIIDNA